MKATPSEARIMAGRLPEDRPAEVGLFEGSPPVEPAALEATRIRHLVQSVDSDAINSWHFDTLQLGTEDIIAYLCQMFAQLGLTRLESDALPAKRASTDHGEHH